MLIEGLKDRWAERRIILSDAITTVLSADVGLAIGGIITDEPNYLLVSVIAGPIIMLVGGAAILGHDLAKREKRLQVMNQGGKAIDAWDKYHNMFPQIPTGLDSY